MNLLPGAVYLVGLMLVTSIASAAGAPYVPDALKPWVPWVLEAHAPTRNCPLAGEAGTGKACIWHLPARIDVRDRRVSFDWETRLFGEGRVRLPGDRDHWPVAITVNGIPQAALPEAGRPYLMLPAGNHRIQGELRYPRTPERITVPGDLGLIDVTINGAPATSVRRTGNALLLAPPRDAETAPDAADALAVRIFRRIEDDVPLRVTTRIEMEISGKVREARLGPALLEGFVPLRLTSALPVRIEQYGSLRVQLRPGTHVVEIVARDTLGRDRFARAAPTGAWPDTEIWSVATDPDLRTLNIQADTPADPARVGAPPDWSQLPTFVLKPDDHLALQPVAPEVAARPTDLLNLERTLWLDNSGDGWTVQDTITGQIRRGQHLTTATDMVLGRATVNGEDRLITLHDSDTRAVSVAPGSLTMNAVSRLEAGGTFAATGWQFDVDRAQALLHLPPGWSLMAARGADRAPQSWLAQWNLLDIFFVLVIAAAFARLLGAPVGLLALVTMASAYPHSGSPKLLWLLALVGVALCRYLPPGRIRQAAQWVRNGALAGIALVCLPWFAALLQQAVYPQLEQPGQVVMAGADDRARESFGASVAMDSAAELSTARQVTALEQQLLPPTAPTPAPNWDATIQTGPGIPEWRGQTVRLEWSGPVTADETVQLLLVPPAVTRLGKVVVVLLVTLLLVILVRGRRVQMAIGTPGRSTPAALILVSLLAAVSPTTDASPGVFPDAAQLEALERRLTQPPACLPDCAVLSMAHIRLSNERLDITLTGNTGTHMALPLPSGTGERPWQAADVTIDGAPAALQTDDDGVLHVRAPEGRHQVRMSGPVSGDSVTLRFALTPAYLSVDAPGWGTAGLEDARLQSRELTLSRTRTAASDAGAVALAPDPAPTFVRIERRLILDREWRVVTRVIRVAPQQGGITLQVPLLPDEAVLSEQPTVTDGHAAVYLAPAQRQVEWVSALPQSEQLVLTAPTDTPWTERWMLQADPRWDVAWAGLAPLDDQSAGTGLRWRPRPGEAVTLRLREPPAAPGATTSIDRAQLDLDAGARATRAELTVNARASIGGMLRVALPDQARLESLTINGVPHTPVVDGGIASAPLVPGAQTVVFESRLPSTTGVVTTSPAFGLPENAANLHLRWQVPRDRWILYTAGPSQGPAVLFWGIVLLGLGIAFGLGRFFRHPIMRTRHWVLLAIGMTGAGSVAAALVVLAWFAVFAQRPHWAPDATPRFNLRQAGLALLTLLFLGSLVASVPMGLLGQPDMHIAGNGSSAYGLHWYAAGTPDGTFPEATVISLPLWVYRLLMLLWSLWLATALMRWLSWGWSAYTHGGLWKPRVILPKRSTPPANPDP